MISVTNPKPHGCEHLLPFPAEKVVSKRWGFQQHGGAFTLQTLMGGPIEWCLVVVLHIFYLRGETEVVYCIHSPVGKEKAPRVPKRKRELVGGQGAPGAACPPDQHPASWSGAEICPGK